MLGLGFLQYTHNSTNPWQIYSQIQYIQPFLCTMLYYIVVPSTHTHIHTHTHTLCSRNQYYNSIQELQENTPYIREQCRRELVVVLLLFCCSNFCSSSSSSSSSSCRFHESQSHDHCESICWVHTSHQNECCKSF